MFVTDLIRDTLTSPKPRRKATAPEMNVTPYIIIFGKWKKIRSSDDLSRLQALIMSLFISYKIH